MSDPVGSPMRKRSDRATNTIAGSAGQRMGDETRYGGSGRDNRAGDRDRGGLCNILIKNLLDALHRGLENSFQIPRNSAAG